MRRKPKSITQIELEARIKEWAIVVWTKCKKEIESRGYKSRYVRIPFWTEGNSFDTLIYDTEWEGWHVEYSWQESPKHKVKVFRIDLPKDIPKKVEEIMVDSLGEVWNLFLKAPRFHPDELTDFKKAIHDAQRIIMARTYLKESRK